MRLDDFVCLGRTVPEASTKYGIRVCMAGYSEELRSLVRVYPLEIRNPVHARDRCVFDLERNPNDSRAESWKLHERNDSIVSVGPDVPTPHVVRWLRANLVESIKELNDRRRSLGVIEADGVCEGFFRRRAEVTCPDQGTLFDIADADHQFGAAALDIAPYLSFSDPAGHRHALQVREWGVYEWLRKEREKAAQVWKNLQLGDGRPTLLVIGNMNNRRNTWLVIKTFKAEGRPGLVFGDEAEGRLEWLAALRAMPYPDYLLTDHWQTKVQETLARDGHRCRICSSAEGLNVHHRGYQRRGDEAPEDLITLCRSCHQLFHENGKLVKVAS